MEFDRLSNLVLLAFNKKITASLEPDLFIDKFASSNRRLILLQYNTFISLIHMISTLIRS